MGTLKRHYPHMQLRWLCHHQPWFSKPSRRKRHGVLSFQIGVTPSFVELCINFVWTLTVESFLLFVLFNICKSSLLRSKSLMTLRWGKGFDRFAWLMGAGGEFGNQLLQIPILARVGVRHCIYWRITPKRKLPGSFLWAWVTGKSALQWWWSF